MLELNGKFEVSIFMFVFMLAQLILGLVYCGFGFPTPTALSDLRGVLFVGKNWMVVTDLLNMDMWK